MEEKPAQESEQSKSCNADSTAKTNIALKKEISLKNSVALIVGTVIGSGIFISPTGILQQTNSVGLSLIVWLACGILAVLASLCFIELGTCIKKSGAEYAYLKEAFGPIPAFLFAWTTIIILDPASCAIISIIFAEYVSKPFFFDCSPPQELVQVLACICLAIVAAVNCWSVRWATLLQEVLTVAKLLCIVMLIIIGVVQLAQGKVEHLQNGFEDSNTDPARIAFAIYLGNWAYGGWNTVNYCIEEMRHPERDLPRAVIIGLSVVIFCYLLINMAYITVLGPAGILKVEAVALSVANAYLGGMNWIVPVLVAASTLGAVNGGAFSAGRLTYVAAREGHMPKVLAMIQVDRLTPLPSLLVTMCIAIVMLLPKSSNFRTLVNFLSFTSWLVSGCVFASIPWLRYRKPQLHRPFKVWLIVPVLLIIIAMYLLAFPLRANPRGSLAGLGIVLAGLIPYVVFVHKKCAPLCFLRCVDYFTNWCQKVFNLALPDLEADLRVDSSGSQGFDNKAFDVHL